MRRSPAHRATRPGLPRREVRRLQRLPPRSHDKPLGVCASCHTTDSFKATRRSTTTRRVPARREARTVACATCHVQPPTQVHLKAGRAPTATRTRTRASSGVGLRLLPPGDGILEDLALRPRARPDTRSRAASDRCLRLLPQGRGGPGRAPAARAVVDFRGAKKDCASCHRDSTGRARRVLRELPLRQVFPRRALPASEFPEFFQAKHATAPCEPCHARGPAAAGATPVLFKGVSTDCATATRIRTSASSGATCQTCHKLQAWPIPAYKHQGRTWRRSSHRSTAPCRARTATRRGRAASRRARARRLSSRGPRASARAATRMRTTGRSAPSASPATTSRSGRTLRAPSTRTRSSRSRAGT